MISSQLSSQLFSKNMTWTLMQRKYSVFSDRNCPSALTVTVHEKCVYVHLPKSKVMRGISVCVSFNAYLSLLIERNLNKSSSGEVIHRAPNIYTVPSSQGDGLQTISVFNNKFKCSCLLSKCLNNRISESPHLYKLIQLSPFFRGQILCHHSSRVLSALGFDSIQEFYEHIPRTKARDSFGSHNNRDYYLYEE